MPGYVNGIPHATSTDRIDLWPTTSRTIAQWVDDNVPRNDDPRLSNARPPTTHTHSLGDVTGLQAALNGKTDTTDPRLSDARPPTSHQHPVSDVTGLQAALDDKTDTTDPRLSDARPPTAHQHPVSDVTGLAARLAALEYDSGWRDVSEGLLGGATGVLHIRRVGPRVHWRIRDYVAGSVHAFYWPPTGLTSPSSPIGYPAQTPDNPSLFYLDSIGRICRSNSGAPQPTGRWWEGTYVLPPGTPPLSTPPGDPA